MKLRAILLFCMISWDASLHFVELFNIVGKHPLYPTFPLFGLISYSIFWTIFWGAGTLIMLTLLGSGTTIKNKTEVHIHKEELDSELKEGDLRNEKSNFPKNGMLHKNI